MTSNVTSANIFSNHSGALPTVMLLVHPHAPIAINRVAFVVTSSDLPQQQWI